MARYSGRELYIEWIDTSGTLNLSGDYRTLNVPETADEIDATAGSDTHKTTLAGAAGGTWTLEMLSAESGTATFARVAPRSSGTLRWSQEGTASGKQKKSAAATIFGRSESIGYNAVTTLSINGTLNADITVASW